MVQAIKIKKYYLFFQIKFAQFLRSHSQFEKKNPGLEYNVQDQNV